MLNDRQTYEMWKEVQNDILYICDSSIFIFFYARLRRKNNTRVRDHAMEEPVIWI